MKKIKILFIILITSLTLTTFAQYEDIAGSDIETAKQFFALVSALYNTCDARLANLYADNAVSRMIRVYPNGETKELTLSGIRIKDAIRQSMKRAKILRETVSFSNANYAQEGDMIRITATYTNNDKNFSAPYDLLIGRNSNGIWRIFSETIQTRP